MLHVFIDIHAGRVEQQKRTRKLLSTLSITAVTNVAVWQECFLRWNDLSAIVGQTSQVSELEYPRGAAQLSQDVCLRSYLISSIIVLMIAQEDFVQWRNLTLFLAAASGVCFQEDYDPQALHKLIPIQILPDEMRTMKNPKMLVERFIKELTDFLISDSTNIRETAREALGTELSPSLYGVLFKHLEE